VDRTSFEIFGNGGRIYMPIRVYPDEDNKTLELYSEGGETRIGQVRVYELKSIWQ
jgi:sucrose-6-phosphate hydrolase SacC (GH32 family)